MSGFQRLSARCAVLAIDNIDTDRIIPARFLKTTDTTSLGSALFADWKLLPNGALNPDFALNNARAEGARILLAGHNFGCGSSREHAPWALLGAGFRAVISTGFGDIFRSNALKNNLLAVTVSEATWKAIAAVVHADPGAELTIDLHAETLFMNGLGAVVFSIDPFARACLLEGVDELGYLLAREALISSHESEHPPTVATK